MSIVSSVQVIQDRVKAQRQRVIPQGEQFGGEVGAAEVATGDAIAADPTAQAELRAGRIALPLLDEGDLPRRLSPENAAGAPAKPARASVPATTRGTPRRSSHATTGHSAAPRIMTPSPGCGGARRHRHGRRCSVSPLAPC